jgi:hypothetical protein
MAASRSAKQVKIPGRIHFNLAKEARYSSSQSDLMYIHQLATSGVGLAGLAHRTQDVAPEVLSLAPLALSPGSNHRCQMTRGEALSLYRPIRAGIQRVLKVAVSACSRADWMRAAKHLGVWSEDRIVVDDERAIEMVSDIALFEPNQRKRRAYDRFLNDQAQRLDPADVDLASRMAGAFFSIFRVVGQHPTAGIWVDDILDDNRRIWLVDEGLERSASAGLVLAMRLFDPGPFHAGFGIVVPADEESTYFFAEAKARGNPLPVRNSLAATLYGEAIWARAPLSHSEESMLSALLDRLSENPPAASKTITKLQRHSKRPSGSRR